MMSAGNVPLKRIAPADAVPMDAVLSRIDYLAVRKKDYRRLIDQHRTDPDYVAELSQDLEALERVLSQLVSLKTMNSDQYNYLCGLDSVV